MNNKMNPRTEENAEYLQKVNNILYDLYYKIDRTNEQRKIIYSLRGIIQELIEFNKGNYFDEEYIEEKCNLIRLDAKLLYERFV